MIKDVGQLDIADGLKELLAKHGFETSNQITEKEPNELALTLGTDEYIAKLIWLAAKNQ
jgi:hypothetical protein